MQMFDEREKVQYVDTHRNFCKALILGVTFIAIFSFFYIQRGFSQKEWQFLSVCLSFIYFNFLIYVYQLTVLLIKNQVTKRTIAYWLAAACVPLVNVLVIRELFILSHKLQKTMQIDQIPWDSRSLRKKNSLSMMISFGIVIAVLHWFAVSKVSVIDPIEKLRQKGQLNDENQVMFQEASQLMNQGQFYQALRKLRSNTEKSVQEQKTFDQLLKAGYQGHAFVLSEKVLLAIKSGDQQAALGSLQEYLNWMRIYSERMGIPKDKMDQLLQDLADIQAVFPPNNQASLAEKRQFYHLKVDSLLQDEAVRGVLKSLVDVILSAAVTKTTLTPAY